MALFILYYMHVSEPLSARLYLTDLEPSKTPDRAFFTPTLFGVHIREHRSLPEFPNHSPTERAVIVPRRKPLPVIASPHHANSYKATPHTPPQSLVLPHQRNGPLCPYY